jgi:hypothetical protein
MHNAALQGFNEEEFYSPVQSLAGHSIVVDGGSALAGYSLVDSGTNGWLPLLIALPSTTIATP